jgi:isochorismate synthase EntC
MPSLVPVTSVRLGEHLPLLELLKSDSPVSWVRGGDGLVGWGTYAMTTVRGADRFEQARQWWHKQLETFSVSNAVQTSGTGPILFTSFSFDPNEESVLVIPKVIVGCAMEIHGSRGLEAILNLNYYNPRKALKGTLTFGVKVASVSQIGRAVLPWQLRKYQIRH